MRRGLITCIALGIGALNALSAHGGAIAQQTALLPELPPPPQGSVQWIAPSMRMNGLPMTLKAFRSSLSRDEVFQYYESIASRWGRSELRRSGDRLSIRGPRHLATIEAFATVRGSEGTITVSARPERARTSPGSSFPRPASAQVKNLQEYDDAGIESEHLSLSSARSVSVEVAAFTTALSRAGWHILRQEPMQATRRGVIIEAQLGAQHALLTVQPDRTQSAATAIVVVWRKS